MTEPVKNEDVLKAVQELGQRFGGLEGRFDGFEKRFDGLEKSVEDLGESVRGLATHMDRRFEQVDVRFNEVDKRLNRVESQMVTKSYLDDKIGDLRVELGTMTKDVDKKDSALVRTLQDKTIIDQSKANEIIAMSPFPQI